MRVLLLGATGNLGSRLVPALLTQGHTVTTYVRSTQKLKSLLPSDVFSQITVVQGDATDSTSIQCAIVSNSCDAVVSAAGLAAMAPWGKSDLPKIFQAVLEGVKAAGKERGAPLRTWFMGGLSVLCYPGTEKMLSDYVPVYLEHRQNLALLQAQPANALEWSLLCPATLVPESSDLSVPTKSTRGELTAAAKYPPVFKDSWISHIPLIGKSIVAGTNVGRYTVTLEQVASFIAKDLARDDSPWVGTTVGVIDDSTS